MEPSRFEIDGMGNSRRFSETILMSWNVMQYDTYGGVIKIIVGPVHVNRLVPLGLACDVNMSVRGSSPERVV